MFPLYRKRTSGICSCFFPTKAITKFKRKPHFSALPRVEELITCVGDVDRALLQLHSCNSKLSKLSNLSISSRFDEAYAPPGGTEGSSSPESTCQ
jgi:hypothetical protein